MVADKLIKKPFTAVVLAPVLLLAFASLPAGASPKVTVLAFGLFGAQSVFESEAKGAANIVAHQLDANAVVVRANTKRRGDVTIASIEDELQSVAGRMDRERSSVSDPDIAWFASRSCSAGRQARRPVATGTRRHA